MRIKLGILCTANSYINGLLEFISDYNDFEIIFLSFGITATEQRLSNQVPDVLLMAVAQNDASAYRIISKLRRSWPAIKMLVLSDHSETYIARRMIESGGHGFINKTAGFSTVIEGCRQLCEGEIYFDPLTRDILLKEIIYNE